MTRRRDSHAQIRGFTLAELVIALAVVAILAAMAVPSLAEAVHRSRRAQAWSALAQVQLAQARWRSTHSTYASELGPLGLAVGLASHYRVVLVEATAHRYTVTATAFGAQAGDLSCTSISLTFDAGQLGMNSTGTAPSRECWRS